MAIAIVIHIRFELSLHRILAIP